MGGSWAADRTGFCIFPQIPVSSQSSSFHMQEWARRGGSFFPLGLILGGTIGVWSDLIGALHNAGQRAHGIVERWAVGSLQMTISIVDLCEERRGMWIRFVKSPK